MDGFDLGIVVSVADIRLAQHQSGDTATAIETQKRAIAVIPEQVNPGVLAKYEAHLSTYQAALSEQINMPAHKVDR